MDCGLPGSSIHGISQERIKEWVASGLPFPPLGDLPNPGIEPESRLLHWQAGSFTTSATWKAPLS